MIRLALDSLLFGDCADCSCRCARIRYFDGPAVPHILAGTCAVSMLRKAWLLITESLSLTQGVKLLSALWVFSKADTPTMRAAIAFACISGQPGTVELITWLLNVGLETIQNVRLNSEIAGGVCILLLCVALDIQNPAQAFECRRMTNSQS